MTTTAPSERPIAERIGCMTADDLAAIRKRALACDDEDRQRRGHFPRRTRCRQCATILTLLAHIEFITPTSETHHAGA